MGIGIGSILNRVLEHVVIHYRWILVCFFLLPTSFLFDIYTYIRSWMVFQMASAPKLHDRKVVEVQQQVRLGLIKLKIVPSTFLFFIFVSKMYKGVFNQNVYDVTQGEGLEYSREEKQNVHRAPRLANDVF